MQLLRLQQVLHLQMQFLKRATCSNLTLKVPGKFYLCQVFLDGSLADSRPVECRLFYGCGLACSVVIVCLGAFMNFKVEMVPAGLKVYRACIGFIERLQASGREAVYYLWSLLELMFKMIVLLCSYYSSRCGACVVVEYEEQAF